MQLASYGTQDFYLTGNPQITFFKTVYRKHTNFSIESVKQVLEGNVDIGNDISCTLSRSGDLIYRMYVEHSASYTHDEARSTNNLNLVERYGDSLIKECKLE